MANLLDDFVFILRARDKGIVMAFVAVCGYGRNTRPAAMTPTRRSLILAPFGRIPL